MGRKVVFSAILAAGLVQMAPAVAQTQDQPQDRESAPANAAPAPAPVMDRARELAENDLAAAPPEEQKPVFVDPGNARALARARQAVAEAQERAAATAAAEAPRPVVVAAAAPPPRPAVAAPVERPAPAPVVAAVEPPAPSPAPAAAPVRESRPVYAADGRDPGYLAEDHADDRADDRVRDERPVYADAAEEPADVPQPRDLRGRQARQIYAEDMAEPALPRDMRERQARQVYADDAPVIAPRRPVEPPLARALPVRTPRPVYADDDRDAGPAGYPAASYPADDGYEPAPRRGERYAIVDRDLRADGSRAADAEPAWGRRAVAPGCDGDRADRLLRSVRRKADFERIEGRTAEDIEDEISHAADLQRSYCASGMNDWREQRLDRLYAQIEDRIRYEEDRRWRR